MPHIPTHLIPARPPHPHGEPVFVVLDPSGNYFRVWADGYTEGFPEGSVVVNGIPLRIAIAVNAVRATPSETHQRSAACS